MERVLQLEACTVDLDRRLVVHDGAHDALTEQEAALLEYLAARPGQPVPRDELLREVWGFTGRNLVTRAVDVAVRRLRMKVERDPSHPAHVLTVRHVGYRFEPTPTRIGVLPETPGVAPPRQAAPAPARLPPERTRFVGREADLEALAAAIHCERGRVVTVVGPPGVGKTRLAVRLGHVLRDAGQPVAFVDLAPARSAADVVGRTADALGIPLDPEGAPEDRAAQLGRALAGRGPMVAVLDNFEHLLYAAPLLPGWLEAAPELRLVATSRERLRLPAEVVIALEPLASDEAVDLFLDRARALDRGWGEDDPDAVARIAADLDGLPLAIELAAARATVLPPRALLDGLRQRFRLLRDPALAADPRQATLRGALEWSWSLLSAAERDALAQLSVFEASFAMDDAEAVVDLSRHDDAPWVLDWLQGLVDKSLLRAVKGRFELLRSLRAFAREQLDGSGRAEDALRRHRDWALGRGEALVAALHGPGGQRSLAALKWIADDLRAVHRRGRDGDPEAVVRAALVLDELLEITGPLDERRALVEDALRVATDPADLSRLLLARAEVHTVRAEQGAALGGVSAAWDAAERADRDDLRARCLEHRAWLHDQRGDYALARADAERGLALARRAGDRVCEAWCLDRLGQLAALGDDLAAAEGHYRAMRAIAQDLGSWRLEVRARITLGFVARTAGRFDECEREYRAAFELAEQAGEVVRQATLLGNLGALASARGELDRAVELFRESLARHRATGNRRLETMALGNYGIVLMAVGRLREARSRLVEAVALADQRDNPRNLGMLEGNLGVLQIQLGEHEQARAHLVRATELLSRWGTPFAHAYYSAHLAIACADLDDLSAALDAAAQVGEALGDHPIVRGLREVLRGHLELARGRQAVREGRDPSPHQRAFEEALDRAERIQRDARDTALSNALNAVLPSELAAALRNLRRTAVDRRLPGGR